MFRNSRLAIPSAALALVMCLQSQAIAQSNEESAIQLQVLKVGGEWDEKAVSYTIERDGERVSLEIAPLAEAVRKAELDFRSETFLRDLLAKEDLDQIDPNLADLKRALEAGGMQALAAEEIVAFAQEGAACIAEGGQLASNVPHLIRSEMDLHYNIGNGPNNTHFGRGQFDISSIKVLLCVVVQNITASYPIIVDRRWVLNVGDEALEDDTDVAGPDGSTIYDYQLKASGEGIELVSYYVDGIRQPRTGPLYVKSASSCIDIYFNFVPGPDESVIISQPSAMRFCAGGACSGVPPKLDATN